MYTTNLRRVGGSVMLAVPPALLDILHLVVGNKVGLAVDHGRLVVEPQTQPKYTLEQLLALSDFHGVSSAEDRAWLDSPQVGEELL